MRSMWNGMISFGLVNIPVGMYPATQGRGVSFNQLHKEDGGRIRVEKHCTKCDEKLEQADLEKGYEFEKDQYVVITDEDLKKVRPEASDNITIHAFVDLDQIDPIFYDTPYYLMPGKKSDKVYALLREALTKSNKVGIATFVLRSKQYLAAVRPSKDALVLDTMHFAEEIRKAEGVPSEKVEVADRELNMALQLIEAMADDWKPEEYKDTYTEALMHLIEQKMEGKEITESYAAPEATDVLDLMSRLKASLENAGKNGSKPAAAEDEKEEDAAAEGEKEEDAAETEEPEKKTKKAPRAKKVKLRLVA